MPNYNRVIPRDFFNEAKLLKCMGHLSTKIFDGNVPEGVKIVIDETGEPFDIRLTSDGRLFIHNYEVTVNDTYVSMSTTYNSKANFPLVCFHNDQEYEVFDDAGEFTEEFKQFAVTINADEHD